MKVTRTDFDGLLVIEPTVHSDERGYFMETYNQRDYEKFSVSNNFVQDNQSQSKKGVLRGLHFQRAPYAQAKLIRVISGAIMDFAVDLRKEKPTFGKAFAIELTHENKKQLFIPKGFAHGFWVLSGMAEVFYKTDQYYEPSAEGGINFFDPVLQLDRYLQDKEYILSEKDKKLPYLRSAEYQF